MQEQIPLTSKPGGYSWIFLFYMQPHLSQRISGKRPLKLVPPKLTASVLGKTFVGSSSEFSPAALSEVSTVVVPWPDKCFAPDKSTPVSSETVDFASGIKLHILDQLAVKPAFHMLAGNGELEVIPRLLFARKMKAPSRANFTEE
jgi:hypothetical protein